MLLSGKYVCYYQNHACTHISTPFFKKIKYWEIKIYVFTTNITSSYKISILQHELRHDMVVNNTMKQKLFHNVLQNHSLTKLRVIIFSQFGNFINIKKTLHMFFHSFSDNMTTGTSLAPPVSRFVYKCYPESMAVKVKLRVWLDRSTNRCQTKRDNYHIIGWELTVEIYNVNMTEITMLAMKKSPITHKSLYCFENRRIKEKGRIGYSINHVERKVPKYEYHFTLFRLPVEISRYCFRVFSCANPSVISSISGKSFHFPFPYFVV